MLEMGQSKPWPKAMQAFTGETGNDATAVIDFRAIDRLSDRAEPGQGLRLERGLGASG